MDCIHIDMQSTAKQCLIYKLFGANQAHDE